MCVSVCECECECECVCLKGGALLVVYAEAQKKLFPNLVKQTHKSKVVITNNNNNNKLSVWSFKVLTDLCPALKTPIYNI